MLDPELDFLYSEGPRGTDRQVDGSSPMLGKGQKGLRAREKAVSNFFRFIGRKNPAALISTNIKIF